MGAGLELRVTLVEGVGSGVGDGGRRRRGHDGREHGRSGRHAHQRCPAHDSHLPVTFSDTSEGARHEPLLPAPPATIGGQWPLAHPRCPNTTRSGHARAVHRRSTTGSSSTAAAQPWWSVVRVGRVGSWGQVAPGGETAMDYVNSVHLVGRVTATGEPRELPSGDTVLTLRVVVPRAERRRDRARAGVDTIDVACWTPAARQVGVAVRGRRPRRGRGRPAAAVLPGRRRGGQPLRGRGPAGHPAPCGGRLSALRSARRASAPSAAPRRSGPSRSHSRAS